MTDTGVNVLEPFVERGLFANSEEAAAEMARVYVHVASTLPLLRWDNKEHFPHLSTHPRHFHMADGRVTESPLTGNPTQDLPKVLEQLRLVLE
ncbi:MAG TPA: hypothetical protein EYP41_11575 [Anaerolineae bacterium]|nr:hypothetical protein [Anaerolineae bacterium]